MSGAGESSTVERRPPPRVNSLRGRGEGVRAGSANGPLLELGRVTGPLPGTSTLVRADAAQGHSAVCQTVT
jgi:hypothetical protein